ncbi:MAG TPA: vanadium-dependent haloperoxidase [Candidatus Acidoferrales bacterium]|nr:vanadium-dependent haloperoxidase [Candidatus Acidoferrales bacterium]
MRTILQFSAWAILASGMARADELTDWNQVMLKAMLTAPVTPAPVTTRVAAIVQAAVFDAVNGIDRRYTPIYVPPAAPPGASRGAAIVQAAYAALVNFYPDQKPKFDQQRTTSLAAIKDSSDAVKMGMAWGQHVADEIWTWRSQDGFSNTLPPFLGNTQPGQWRPTPPAMAPGLVPQLAKTNPWVIPSPSYFRPNGPADMTSDQYTSDFNETKNMGGSNGSGRTADQTLFSNFWQAGNPPDYWDPVATSIAAQRNYSAVQTARLLALVNLGIADAAIGCWDAKYTYSSWRPITAIQLGDTDGNDATTLDPSWTPLIVTPPFPEYPSAHSCVSGAAGRILSAAFGEQTSFSVVSNAMPGVTRKFHSFSAALEEVKNARIFGGIHFRTACVDGQALGITVADYVMSRALVPLRGEHGGRGN